jgi:hypothetical protein
MEKWGLWTKLHDYTITSKTNYLLQTFGEPIIEEDFLELAYE